MFSTVHVIGHGRAGSAINARLVERGHVVAGRDAGLVVLWVPDRAVAGVARRVPVSAAVEAPVGGALRVTLSDDAGHEVTVAWDRPLEAAQKHPLNEQTFREQFCRLGDTPLELTEVKGLESPSGAIGLWVLPVLPHGETFIWGG